MPEESPPPQPTAEPTESYAPEPQAVGPAEASQFSPPPTPGPVPTGPGHTLPSQSATSSDPAGSAEYSAHADIDSPEPASPLNTPPHPAAASGPPWPRLVASGPEYVPPRLVRWPIVLGIVLLAGSTATAVASRASTSSAPTAAAPYVFTASDARFTATFPGKPQRTENTIGTISAVTYTSTLADHAVAITYLPLPVSATFSLEGAVTGAAAGEKGGKLVSHATLTYQGQHAEDGKVTFSGGFSQVRAVVFGSSAYIFEGVGKSPSSFRNDYNVLLDSFTSTSPPSRPATSSSNTGTGTATAQRTPSVSATAGRPLASMVVPPPAGFTESRQVGVHNGPLNAAGFDAFIGKGTAVALHYVTGYQIAYDSAQSGVDISLFRFATPEDATNLLTGFSVDQLKNGSYPAIPGARVFDSTAADSTGTYEHALIASKGDTVMLVEDLNGSPARPALLDLLSRQQYAKI